MTVYALAQLTIHDRPTYQRYVERFADTLPAFGGRLLAADEAPLVLEGEWKRDKAVLVQFPDEDAMRGWATSPAYREIVGDRVTATEGPILLLRGV